MACGSRRSRNDSCSQLSVLCLVNGRTIHARSKNRKSRRTSFVSSNHRWKLLDGHWNLDEDLHLSLPREILQVRGQHPEKPPVGHRRTLFHCPPPELHRTHLHPFRVVPMAVWRRFVAQRVGCVGYHCRTGFRWGVYYPHDYWYLVSHPRQDAQGRRSTPKALWERVGRMGQQSPVPCYTWYLVDACVRDNCLYRSSFLAIFTSSSETDRLVESHVSNVPTYLPRVPALCLEAKIISTLWLRPYPESPLF